MCTRICTRLADRRRHHRYCLHRSNLLMARPTRWIRDRVSCVFCIPISRRGEAGSTTRSEWSRIDHAGGRGDTPPTIDLAVPFAYYRSIPDRNLRRLSFRLPCGRLSLRTIFDDNRSDEGNGLVSIYVTAYCTHTSSVLVSLFSECISRKKN